MRRLLYIQDRYPELSQTFVSNEIEGLRARGHYVRVCSSRPGVQPEDNQIVLANTKLRKAALAHFRSLLRQPVRYLRYLAYLAKCGLGGLPWTLYGPYLALEVRNSYITNIHTHFSTRAAAVARAVQVLTMTPRSVTTHAADIYVSQKHIANRLERAKILTISEANRSWLETNFGQFGPFSLVRCGVALEPCFNAEATRRSTIVAAGRLVEKKGFDDLIRAGSLLRQQGLDLKLRIVGNGPMLDHLKVLSRTLNVGDATEFIGALGHEETLREIASAHIFCLPCKVSRNGDVDGIPVVLMEAMASGTPVVTCSVSGIPELVSDDNGWISEPDSPVMLARVLKEALENPKRAQRKAANARARIASQYSIDQQVDGLLKVLEATEVSSGDRK